MLGTLAETSESLTIYVNEKKIIVPRFASVNGSLQSNYYEIQEDDEIVILNYYTVGQIIEFMDVVLDPNMNLYVNNKLADRDTPVYENFSVLWTLETLPNAIDLWQEGKTGDMDLGDEEDTGENGDGYQSDAAGDGSEVKLLPEKQEITLELMVNGKPVALSGKDEYIYVDVFEAIDFDLTRPRGKSIVTTLNGRSAQYMEPLHSGDVLEVYWKS